MADRPQTSFGPADPMLAFLEAMPDGMVASDTDGRIVLVNGLLEKLSGFLAEELIGQQVEVLVPDRYRAVHGTHRGGYYAAGLPPRAMGSGLEIFLRRKDGTEVPVDIALSSIRLGGNTLVLSAVRDASERKQAEAAIHASEERFRAVAETAVDAIISADSAGVVTYLNRGAEAMLGYSREEIYGQPLTLLMPERFQEAHRRGFARYLETREPHMIGSTPRACRRAEGGQRVPGRGQSGFLGIR